MPHGLLCFFLRTAFAKHACFTIESPTPVRRRWGGAAPPKHQAFRPKGPNPWAFSSKGPNLRCIMSPPASSPKCGTLPLKSAIPHTLCQKLATRGYRLAKPLGEPSGPATWARLAEAIGTTDAALRRHQHVINYSKKGAHHNALNVSIIHLPGKCIEVTRNGEKIAFDVFSLKCVGISVRTWKTLDLGAFLRNAKFLRHVSVMYFFS